MRVRDTVLIGVAWHSMIRITDYMMQWPETSLSATLIAGMIVVSFSYAVGSAFDYASTQRKQDH